MAKQFYVVMHMSQQKGSSVFKNDIFEKIECDLIQL